MLRAMKTMFLVALAHFSVLWREAIQILSPSVALVEREVSPQTYGPGLQCAKDQPSIATLDRVVPVSSDFIAKRTMSLAGGIKIVDVHCKPSRYRRPGPQCWGSPIHGHFRPSYPGIK